MNSQTKQTSSIDIAGLERHKANVLRDWGEAEIVAGWEKWYGKYAEQSRQATAALARAARLGPGVQVLDLASGPGDPAITLADLVAPGGHVTSTDFSDGMVAAAKANAARRGKENMSFQVADMENLPFPDERFDTVTCRFGLMFCPDKALALAESLRILKRGGSAAFVVWGAPFEQGFIATTMSICSRYTSLPECEVGAPTAFDFAQTGKLAAMMEQAGFEEVEEEHVAITMPWAGSAEEYWQYVRETAAPIREVLQKMRAEGKAGEIDSLIEDLIAGYRGFAKDGVLEFPATVNVAGGRRPG